MPKLSKIQKVGDFNGKKRNGKLIYQTSDFLTYNKNQPLKNLNQNSPDFSDKVIEWHGLLNSNLRMACAYLAEMSITGTEIQIPQTHYGQLQEILTEIVQFIKSDVSTLKKIPESNEGYYTGLINFAKHLTKVNDKSEKSEHGTAGVNPVFEKIVSLITKNPELTIDELINSLKKSECVKGKQFYEEDNLHNIQIPTVTETRHSLLEIAARFRSDSLTSISHSATHLLGCLRPPSCMRAQGVGPENVSDYQQLG